MGDEQGFKSAGPKAKPAAGGFIYNILHAVLLVAVTVSLFYFLYSKGFILKDDSYGYINNSIYRTPLYPLFIDIFEKYTGAGYLKYVCIGQIALGFFSALILCHTLIKIFGFSNWAFHAIYIAALLPFLGPGSIANAIMSECLAYSMFLIAASYLIKSVYEPAVANFFLLAVFSALAALTRPQFIFMYALLVFFIIFIFLNIRDAKKTAYFVFILVLAVAGANFFQRAYNYHFHGQFSGIPFTGIQAITPAIYLTDSSEISLFTDTKEIEFLASVYEKTDREKLSVGYNNPPNFIEYATHYSVCYNEIAWRTVHGIYRDKYCKKTEMTPEEMVEFNSFTSSLAARILKDRYKQFARLFTANILKGIGGYFYLALLLFVLGYSLLAFNSYGSKLAGAVFFATLCNFLNYFLIALVEPVMLRYSFYTDVLQLVVLMSFFALAARDLSSGPSAGR